MAEQELLRLAHDVLDAQLCDRAGEYIGRVDDLEFTRATDGRIVVSAILVGGPVRAARVGVVARFVSLILNAVTRSNAKESRIPFGKVRVIGETIHLDVAGDALPSSHLEVWLRDRVVCRLPWSSGERK